MSVLMTTPERQSFPYEESRTEQQFDPRDRLRQVFCVLLLLLADLSTIAAGLKLAIFVRLHLSVHTVSNLPLWTFPFRYYLAFWWLWLLPLLFLAVEGLYTQRRSLWSEIGYLTKAICMSLAAVLAAVALTQQVVSRGTVLLTGVNLLILLPAARFWTKQLLGAAGLWRKRILVLGASGTGSLAIRGLTSDPVLGYEVVGVLDDDPAKRGKRIGAVGGQPIFVLGNLSEARQVMEQTQTRDVLIAMPNLPEAKLLALVQEFQPYCGSIYVVPQLWGLPMMNLQVEGFLRERVMMLKLSNNLAKPWNTWLKRGADLLLGAAATVFVLPICLILAALIKIDSEGPAVLFQERLGYRGRNFRCLKFRTMYINNEKKLEQYIASNPEAAAEWLKYAKLRNYDPRVTRLGRFLRKWSLDELPQLLNVLKGQMSLVGPRPYLPQERDRIGVELPTILSARPGITGFWQVSGRNQLTFDERVQVEAWYIRNWSIWLDCIVLIKTIRIVLFPESKTNDRDNAAPDGAITAFPNFPAAAPGFSVTQREGLCESD